MCTSYTEWLIKLVAYVAWFKRETFPLFAVIAFCPNNNQVHIYKFFTDKWEKLHVLSKVNIAVFVSQGMPLCCLTLLRFIISSLHNVPSCSTIKSSLE
jgi:hypothetical protein